MEEIAVKKEVLGVELGDSRLSKRCGDLISSMADFPERSIYGSFQSWSEVKAAYRFFDNKKVSSDALLAPHRDRVLERMAGEEVILCIQDTTILNFSQRKPVEGLGHLRYEHEQGLLMHSMIAVTPEKVCLGVLSNKTWIREKLQGKAERQRVKAVEEKESLRWIEQYRLCSALQKQHFPGTTLINISDREGDFYELFQEYQSQEESAHWLVRGKSDRVIGASEPSESSKLLATLRALDPCDEVSFEVKTTTKGRKTRRVTQQIRMSRIQLSPPRKVRKLNALHPIEITALLCTEIHAPDGEEPLEWFLLTSLEPNATFTPARIAAFYTCRWQIELFFKVLKSGCGVEKLQFEHYQRIVNCIALYCIIAWRIMALTMLGRLQPEQPCTVFYEENEWKAACHMAQRNPPTHTTPSLKEINRIVASFGGFLHRKGDGEPGHKVIWLGLQRLRDFTLAFEYLQQQTCG